MAAKHDGKHARANMWVTHQNLARAKGGRPGYQFKERKIAPVPKAAAPIRSVQPTPAPSPVLAAETTSDRTSTSDERGSFES